MNWDDQFLLLFEQCTTFYRGGNKDFDSYYQQKDLDFLGSIGYRPREFFDFVEDFCEEGEPSPSTSLLVAAARRDYFLTVLKGKNHEPTLNRDNIPGFGEELAGIPYLPRILVKGRAKLRGELDPDLMFGCGGDRNFLAKNGALHPADFLRHLWACGQDDQKMVEWILHQTGLLQG